MPFRVPRRLAVVVATVLLVGIPGGVVLAGAGGATGTISMSVPNPTRRRR